MSENSLKRYVPIFVLLLYAYNLAGYLGFHLARQSAIREEIRTTLRGGFPDSVLTVVGFATSSIRNGSAPLKWTDENEFRYGDSMYDIVRSYSRGDSTFFVCLNDVDEAQVLASIDRHVDRELNSSGRSALLDSLQDAFKDAMPRSRVTPADLACFGRILNFELNFLSHPPSDPLYHPPHSLFT